MNNADM